MFHGVNLQFMELPGGCCHLLYESHVYTLLKKIPPNGLFSMTVMTVQKWKEQMLIFSMLKRLDHDHQKLRPRPTIRL